MTEQIYQETLSYLYSLLPMYQRDGSPAFKKGLDNINALCWNLGLPQWKFSSIHVAGTNGKGSVSSMLTSILIEAGYKVGTYTSPHLVDFTERIRVNGKNMEKNSVVEFVDCYRKVIEKVQPSFFELTVAMAFEYFAEQEVDIAVIEVGLGGRLDSTNIIRPELSVITNISYDHQDMLGDTLGEIAFEKAGIIKPFTPVVIGERHPETQKVFADKASELGAPLTFAEDRFKLEAQQVDRHGQQLEFYNVEEEVNESFALDLLGKYQIQNLRTALTAIELLREDVWDVEDEAIQKGLRKVAVNSGLRGRMEKLFDTPQVWCDTGHNPAGVAMIFEQLNAIPHNRMHIVWGMAKDKKHQQILNLLPKDASYYFVKPDVPRGLPAYTLQIMAESTGLSGEVYDSVLEGVQMAMGKASPSRDLIFIGGSTFVVADILKDWQEVVGTA